MTEQAWGTLRHFKIDERDQKGGPAFPRPEKMSLELMLLLDSIREHVGRAIIVHYSYEERPGEHGEGNAVDCHISGMGVIEQYLTVEQFNPPGLGFYPHWRSPGLHVDYRKLEGYQKAARWWRDERGNYQPITVAAIKRFIWKEGA